MTLEMELEILEEITDLDGELEAALAAGVDADTLREVVGSVRGGLADIRERVQAAPADPPRPRTIRLVRGADYWSRP